MSRFNTTPGGANSGGNDMVEPQLRTAMMMQSSSASTRSSDYRNHQFPPTTSSMMTNADFGMSAAGYGGQDTSGFRAYDDPSSFGAHHHPHHPQFQQQPTSLQCPTILQRLRLLVQIQHRSRATWQHNRARMFKTITTWSLVWVHLE